MPIHGQIWWMRGYLAAAGLLFVLCNAAHIAGIFDPAVMARRAGIASTAEELETRTQAVAQEDNAVTYLLRADEKMESRTIIVAGDADWPCYPAPLSPVLLAAFERLSNDMAPAIEEIRKAVQAPRAQFPWYFGKELIAVEDCQKVLSQLLYGQTASARTQDAVETLELMAGIARMLGDSTENPWQYHSYLYALERGWNSARLRLTLDDAALQRIGAAFEAIGVPSPGCSLEVDRIREYHSDASYALSGGSHWLRELVARWLVTGPALEGMNVDAIALAKAGVEPHVFEDIMPTIVTHGAAVEGIIFPFVRGYWSYGWARENVSTLKRNTIRVKALTISVALERYKRAYGGYPESLDAIVPEYLEAIPNDSASGHALLSYWRMENGYALFNPGPNGRQNVDRANLWSPFRKGDDDDFLFVVPEPEHGSCGPRASR